MKVAFLLLLLLGLAVVGGDAPSTPSDRIGRFQLVQAEVTVYDDGPRPKKILLKLDTATGDTWMYHDVSLAPPPRLLELGVTTKLNLAGWLAVSNDYSQVLTGAVRHFEPTKKAR